MKLGSVRALCLASLLAAAGGAAVAAKGILVKEAQLVSVLSASPQCCVVDARATAREPAIEGALPYSKGLRIRPTSTVVVVADDDSRALSVARALARSSGHDVHALSGGHAAWRAVERELQKAQAGAPGTSYTFVIPRDTCQQGEPLQILQSKPQGPGMSKPGKGAP